MARKLSSCLAHHNRQVSGIFFCKSYWPVHLCKENSMLKRQKNHS